MCDAAEKSKLYQVEVEGFDDPFFTVADNSQQAVDNIVEKHKVKKENIKSVKMMKNFTSNGYKIASIYGSRDDDDDWF
jgi:hypothetical protein